MITVTDGRGVEVSLPRPPERIVSLVPSTTETLFALGLGDRVIGITRFCVHPREQLEEIVKVGGTKDLVEERMEALQPDLVIGNAEENTREMFAWVEARWPLYVAFPRSVDAAIADLRTLGRLVGAPEVAEARAVEIEAARAALAARPFSYAYLIWREPWMAVNDDTFIAAMLAEAGGRNIFGTHAERYPTIEPTDLTGADQIFLSSEPFPFADKHVAELVERGLSRGQLRLVDGELCSWHGVRMAAGFRYLGGLRT